MRGGMMMAAARRRASGGDPYFNLRSSILHFDSGSSTITDVKGKTWTAEGNATCTETGKWGNALTLDGTGDRVLGTDHADYDISTGDFTLEFWAKNVGTNPGAVLQIANGGWGAMVGYPVAGNLTFYASSAAAGWDVAAGVSMGATPGATFVHFAVVREGDAYSTYRGGSRVSTFTKSGSIFMPSGAPAIGSYIDTAGAVVSYNSMIVDDLRVSKRAEYSGATYTVPTAAFPDS